MSDGRFGLSLKPRCSGRTIKRGEYAEALYSSLEHRPATAAPAAATTRADADTGTPILNDAD
jgi:hypothetical protein